MADLDQLLSLLPQGLKSTPEEQRVLAGILAPVAAVDEVLSLRARALGELLDPSACPDECVRHLGGLVGVGTDLGAAQAATVAELRKLIQVAARLWRSKGTFDSYRGVVASLAGSRALILSWFSWRAVDGVWGGWLPMAPEVGEDPASYYSPQEHVTDVWIADPDGEINRSLVLRWLEVVRPVNERINVYFADFVDDCGVGVALWTWTQTGSWGYSEARREIAARNGAAFVASAGGAEASWGPVYIFWYGQITGVGDFRFRSAGTTYYQVLIDVPARQIDLIQVIAGTPTLLGSVTSVPIAEGVSYRWIFEAWNGSGHATIRVNLGGDTLIEVTDSTGGRPSTGTFRWGGVGSGDVLVLQSCIIAPPGRPPDRVGPFP